MQGRRIVATKNVLSLIWHFLRMLRKFPATSDNLRQKPWNTLENSAPFRFPPPFCNVVVATQLCNNISTLQAERDVHRCFKDFWRGLWLCAMTSGRFYSLLASFNFVPLLCMLVKKFSSAIIVCLVPSISSMSWKIGLIVSRQGIDWCRLKYKFYRNYNN